MLKMMLSAQAPREAQVLEVVMKSLGFNVIQFDTKSRFFIKMLQFMPDLIIMEIPAFTTEHLSIIDLMQRHKAISRIPILGFGPQADPNLISGVFKGGTGAYITRPLTLDVIKKNVESALQKNKKSLSGSETAASAPEFDYSIITDCGVAPMKKIEALSSHVAKLLAFPFTVPRVLQITAGESKGAGELARVIESDPVITTQILKVSNTVFFASLNRRISSVKDAVVRLGFSETKRIVMGMAVMKLFDNTVRNAGFDRIEFWHHSIATAIIAERLGRRMGGLDNDEVFISGLMHDLGILIMDEFFPELLTKVMATTTAEGVEFIAAEKAVMGVTHHDITAVLFEKWRMHEDVTSAVLNKDRFREVAPGASTNGEKIAVCVGLAETVVKTVCLGRECDEYVRPVDNSILNDVKMATGFTETFLKDVYRDMGFYRRFFNLAHTEFPTRHEGITNPEEVLVAIINQAGENFVLPELYLKKEKVAVEVITRDTDPDTLAGKFDIILLWCEHDVRNETVTKYLKIQRRKTASDYGKKDMVYAPVLACLEPDTMMHKFEEFANVSMVPRHIDMRKLDRALCEITLGKKVDFTVYSIAPMQTLSAAALESKAIEESKAEAKKTSAATPGKDAPPAKKEPEKSAAAEKVQKPSVSESPPAAS